MNEQLEYIFSNVNEWLRFAEAKHSGLIALSSAILLAVPSVLKRPKQIFWKVVFIFPAILFGVAIFISLSSFSPVLKKITDPKAITTKENHYFFEEIAKMDETAFKTTVMGKGDYSFSHLEEDLIDQIISNARITSLKMKSFRNALVYFKIGLGLLALLFISRYMFGKEV